MYKYCYIEPIIFTSYLIWYTGRIWNGYVASRFNRIGEIAEVLNSSMTEFFKKNDSVRARPDYLADSINPLPLGKSDMRRNRPSCNGVPNKQMLRTRHHVFEHRNLAVLCQPRHWDVSTACSGTVRTARRGLEEERMTDTCRLYRLGLLTRMPLCLGKHIEWDCGTASFHSQIGRKRYESRKMDTCGDCDSDRHSGWDGRVKTVEADFSASTVFFLFQNLILYGQRTETRKMNLPNLSENFPLVHLI